MEIASQKALEQSFQRLTKDCAARNPIVFYYEDLKDGAMHAESRWGELFASLKIWSPSELAIIHGDKPVMDTIANPRDVYEALEGTKYEWMVRE